jgi:SHS family lactate transporter-like MFS transporter
VWHRLSASTILEGSTLIGCKPSGFKESVAPGLSYKARGLLTPPEETRRPTSLSFACSEAARAFSRFTMAEEKYDTTEQREYAPTARKMSAGHYMATRIPTLKPARDKVANPIALLRMLNLQQWLFFLVAFVAWTWDAFDFFTVSLTIEDLAETFGKTKADITWGITLVLMLRSVGSIIFGLAADRYGRKWPFIINNLLFIVLELGTGFCSTYNEFLGVRALFGIAMGGLYGNAAATGKPHFPYPHRSDS